MSTTRDEAYLAAHAVMMTNPSEGRTRRAVDAASDVWEEMVRHLITAGDALVRSIPPEERKRTETDEAIFHWIKSVADIEELLA